MKSNLIDIMCQKHHETAKAVLVSTTGQGDDAVWLLKSQIEMEERHDGFVDVTMPEWLAKDKGLI